MSLFLLLFKMQLLKYFKLRVVVAYFDWTALPLVH